MRGRRSRRSPRPASARASSRELWWVMAAGAVVIFLLVIGCAVYATLIAPAPAPGLRRHLVHPGRRRRAPGRRAERAPDLQLRARPRPQPGARARGAAHRGRRQSVVVGGALSAARRREPVVSANELRLPVGEPVELRPVRDRRDPQLLGAEHRRQARHDPGPGQPPGARGRGAGHLPRAVRRVLRRRRTR